MNPASTADSDRPDLTRELDFGRQFIKLLLDGTTPERTPLRILTALYVVGYYTGALSPLITDGIKQALLACVADGMDNGMKLRDRINEETPHFCDLTDALRRRES